VEHKERWMQLAELAANEHDPDKLLVLVKELNHLLEEGTKRIGTSEGYGPVAADRAHSER